MSIGNESVAGEYEVRTKHKLKIVLSSLHYSSCSEHSVDLGWLTRGVVDSKPLVMSHYV